MIALDASAWFQTVLESVLNRKWPAGTSFRVVQVIEALETAYHDGEITRKEWVEYFVPVMKIT